MDVSDRFWANNIDPDRTDQGLHILPYESISGYC